MFEVITGSPDHNSFKIDFSNDTETKFKLSVQTDLSHDSMPVLGGDLLLMHHNVISNMGATKWVQYWDKGFEIHPASWKGPLSTDDDMTGTIRLFAWEIGGTPYNVAFRCPPVADLAGSGSLDADNGLIWTLPFEDGSSGQVLQTDGSRVLSFVDSGGGSYSWTASDQGASNEEITNGMTFEFRAGTFLAAGLTTGPSPYIEYDLGASGTADDTTFLRGDNTWAVPSGSGGSSWVIEDDHQELEIPLGTGSTDGLLVTHDTFIHAHLTSGASVSRNYITIELAADSSAASATTFLCGDNTWKVPSGGGGGGMTSFTVASLRYENPFDSPTTSSWVMSDGKEIEFWSYDKSIQCSAATDEKMNIQIPYGEFTYDGDTWGRNGFIFSCVDSGGSIAVTHGQNLSIAKLNNLDDYADWSSYIIFDANHNEAYPGYEDNWRFLHFKTDSGGVPSTTHGGVELQIGRQLCTNIGSGYNGDPLDTGDASATAATLVYNGGTITNWTGDIPIGGEDGDEGEVGKFVLDAGPGIHLVVDVFGTTTYNIGLLHHIDEEDTGTYGSATKSAVVTVNKQGIVTNITEVTISGGGGGGGTVTSVDTGNGLQGGEITTSGTIEVDSTVLQTVNISEDGGTTSGDSYIDVGQDTDNVVGLVAGDNVTLTGDDAAGTIKIESSGGGGGSLTVKEVDGSPSVSSVDTIVVSNGTLTDDGGGQVTVTTGGGGGCGDLPESDHPYASGIDETWEYECCCASSIDVTFNADTETESGYDYIYIYDGDDVQISGSPFEGTELASATKTVSGSKVKIRLTSDGSVQEYGFKVTSIVASGGGGGGNLTTKGDLEVFTTSQTRLGVGVDDDFLVADSTAASGVAWKNVVYRNLWTEDGDDLYFSTGNVAIGVTTPVSRLTIEGTTTLKEQADAGADTAGYGQIWIKDDDPCTIWFTDDAGTDTQLGTGGGGGVTSVATSNGTFIDVTGGTITSTGTITGDLSATGTPGASVYLRGDNTWAAIGSEESPWTEDGDDIYFDGGDVAIGVTTPVSKLTVEGTETLKEQAAADADTAGYGQIWVKDDAPNTLWFTDDAGTDTQLGTGGGAMTATQITSGTSSTFTENGTDQLIGMDDYDPGDNYRLTIPRPSEVPAGRRFQFWLENLSGYYFAVQTSDSGDLFQISYNIYNGYTAERYLETYLYNVVIFTIYSDGLSTWYSDNAAYSGNWWLTSSPV